MSLNRLAWPAWPAWQWAVRRGASDYQAKELEKAGRERASLEALQLPAPMSEMTVDLLQRVALHKTTKKGNRKAREENEE